MQLNIDKIKTELFELCLENKGVREALNYSARILDVRLAVFSSDGMVLALSDVENNNWEDLGELELVSKAIKASIYSYAVSKEVYFLISDEGKRYSATNLISKNRVIGTLVASGIGEEYNAILSPIAFSARVSISQTEDAEYFAMNPRERILHMLVAGERDIQYISLLCKLSDISFPKPYVITVIQFGITKLLTYHEKNFVINRYAAAVRPFSSIWYGNSLVFVSAGTKNDGLDLNFANKMCALNKEFGATVGFSNKLFSLHDFSTGYHQALFTVMFNSPDHDEISKMRFSHTAFFDLLSQLEDKISLKAYCHPTIPFLKSYDEKHRTELYKTFCAYVKCNQSIAKTLQVLNIHRNTLTYQLKRIKEIVNIDFDDYDKMFMIQCSIKIMDYLEMIKN